MQTVLKTNWGKFPTPEETSINKPILKKGSRGPSVVELQNLLNCWDMYLGSLNGIFDQKLENSVKAFQHRVFLEEDGIVDHLTWKALYTGVPVNMPTLVQGNEEKSVVILQRLLQITGDFHDKIDGKFGAETDTAVRAFQKRNGLKGDGIVSDRIWYLLSKVPH